jgi:Type VI secretion system VasI, EvfG, VC_A0118
VRTPPLPSAHSRSKRTQPSLCTESRHIPRRKSSAATMHAILTIGFVIVVLGASAHAQEALKLCRQIKNDAERLKCYDGLDTPSSSATGGQAESEQGANGAWAVREEKSPLDDSPVISAQLPSTDGKASLLMRCKDGKTEVAVNKWGFTKCGDKVRVIYRIDQGQAVDSPWNAHSSCYLAIAPSPIPFIRALTDQGKVYFRMWDHHDVPHEALFNLGDLSAVRSRLAEACNWDGAPKATGNPVPKAAPEVSPKSRR